MRRERDRQTQWLFGVVGLGARLDGNGRSWIFHSGELDGIWVTARSKRDLEVTSTRLLLQDGELTELEYGRHEWLTMRVVHRIFTECGDSSPRVECSRNAPEGLTRCGPVRCRQGCAELASDQYRSEGGGWARRTVEVASTRPDVGG